VIEKLPKIKWDPIVDDRPNTSSPRIKFSQEFTKENLRESNGIILDLGYESFLFFQTCIS
jgi:hypothetical protein